MEQGVGAFAPAMVKMFTGGHVGKLLVELAPRVPSVGETPPSKKAA